MMQSYYPQGTCSTEIRFEVADGVLRKVEFSDGCEGNLTGIGRLVTGMKVEDVNRLLKQFDQMQKLMKQFGKFGKGGASAKKLKRRIAGMNLDNMPGGMPPIK